MKRLIACAVFAALPAVSTVVAAEPATKTASPGAELKTDEEKTLYALGMMISRNLAPFSLTEADLELVRSGLVDGVLGKEAKVDLNAFGPKIQELANTRRNAQSALEKKAAEEFLAKSAEEKGVVKTASGILYKEITPGTGEAPKATDKVKVHYHGTTREGKVFDSSVQRGQPAEFSLNGVIKCWTEGVQLMKVGGKSRLVCPPDLAYGDRGAPPDIKPGAALVFDVELLEIVK